MSSSEFVQWQVYLSVYAGWQEPEKIDHYLASICAEIRRFREGFSNSPKSVSVEDMLLEFRIEESQSQERKPVDKPRSSMRESAPYDPPPRKPPSDSKVWVETGPKLVQDPKWAKVNAAAKASWAAKFGVVNLEDLNDHGR